MHPIPGARPTYTPDQCLPLTTLTTWLADPPTGTPAPDAVPAAHTALGEPDAVVAGDPAWAEDRVLLAALDNGGALLDLHPCARLVLSALTEVETRLVPHALSDLTPGVWVTFEGYRDRHLLTTTAGATPGRRVVARERTTMWQPTRGAPGVHAVTRTLARGKGYAYVQSRPW